MRSSSRYASMVATPAAHASGWPAYVETGPEHVRVEVLRDRLVDDDAAERDVSRVHTLREGHHVRHDALMLRGEPLSGAAEARS